MIRDIQTQKLTWSQPPSRPALGEEDVDIWRASLATSPMYVERSTRLLARDEMARANKFYFHVDRDNFIVARAFLRIITGLDLGVDPRELRFDYGKDGKPSLVKAVKDGMLGGAWRRDLRIQRNRRRSRGWWRTKAVRRRLQ